jgi:hypothetical protein
MPITIHCSSCKTRLTLGDDRAGATITCPRCNTPLTAPGRAPPPLPAPVLARTSPPPLPATHDDEDDWASDNERRLTKRRMWRGLAVGGALVVVALVAWALVPKPGPRAGDGRSGPAGFFGSLNSAERTAVGTWTEKDGGPATLTLRDDRTFSIIERDGGRVLAEIKGEWRIDGDKLLIKATSISSERPEDGTNELGEMRVEVPLTIVSQSENKLLLRSKSGKRVVEYNRF